MKLTVLVENTTLIDKYLLGEPGLSFLLEAGGKKILFDTGYSDVFIKNAKLLGIPLEDLDYIVISHGHNDHVGGLKHLLNLSFKKSVKLIAHSAAFEPKLYGKDEKIGLDIPLEVLAEKFEICYKDKPFEVLPGLIFLGEIPRISELEPPVPYGKKLLTGKDDFLLDDTALAFKSKNGLVIITGCSHSGIVNICEFAKKVCGCNKISAIIGGLHLLRADDSRINKTVDYFKAQNLDMIYPCHCTGFDTICKMYQSLNVKSIGVGSEMELF